MQTRWWSESHWLRQRWWPQCATPAEGAEMLRWGMLQWGTFRPRDYMFWQLKDPNPNIISKLNYHSLSCWRGISFKGGFMPQTAAKPKQNQPSVSSSASSMPIAASQSSHVLFCWVSWSPAGRLTSPSPVKLACCLGAAQGMGWSPLWDASRRWPRAVLYWGLLNSSTWGQLTNASLAKKLDSHFQTQKLILERWDVYLLYSLQEKV